MIWIEESIKQLTVEAVKELFNKEIGIENVSLNQTRKEFEGDFTVVIFALLKFVKGNPVEIGNKLGEYIVANGDFIEKHNVEKGFLNLKVTNAAWLNNFNHILSNPKFAYAPANTKDKVVLEYCGPNTNKPLHFGHVRNMMLGFSTAEILMANGHEVHKVNILNDRGIAICKSMLAWQEFGNNETPQSTNTKGDHFVGKYYVEFSKALKAEVSELIASGMEEKEAKKEAPIQKEAQEMLRKWEAGDKEILDLWDKMNNWVYEGFEVTYDKLGVDFEKAYAESDYYLKGKDLVYKGLEDGLFTKKEDDSIWVDLTEKGEDEKILLRSDGTSVYLTQDLGVAEARYNDFGMKQSIYVVADEQNYHFKVLKLTLQELKKPYADGIFHLAYGMVDLPGGAKMKSREGTTVDADDLIAEVIAKAKVSTLESGKIDDFTAEDQEKLFEIIGIGALKFFILSVSPKKRMVFDPEESVSLTGFTAPAIQYAYTRTQSVLNKYDSDIDTQTVFSDYNLNPEEKELVKLLYQFKKVIKDAGDLYDPSLIAHHAYNLRTTYNKFWENCKVLDSSDTDATKLRVYLCSTVGIQIKHSLNLLGILAPERM
ncbi:UNVERIFIED_CONTAM: hypothetical protein GTU68_002048 [Idotea baltica]|nr:hypothetical protein [Idotea baltica]